MASGRIDMGVPVRLPAAISRQPLTTPLAFEASIAVKHDCFCSDSRLSTGGAVVVILA